MRIVVIFQGTPTYLEVDSSSTIKQVKEEALKHEKLYFNGAPLDENSTITECGLFKDVVLTLETAIPRAIKHSLEIPHASLERVRDLTSIEAKKPSHNEEDLSLSETIQVRTEVRVVDLQGKAFSIEVLLTDTEGLRRG
jgi:hypothetical protein